MCRASAVGLVLFFGQAGCSVSRWGFPKIGGTILRVPIIRAIVYWGPHLLGKLPNKVEVKATGKAVLLSEGGEIESRSLLTKRCSNSSWKWHTAV